MPVFISMLMGALFNMAASLVGRVVIALGLSVITFTGLNMSLDWAKSLVLQSLSGLPAELFQLLAYMGVGEFLSIIFSALTARMLLNGLTDGSLKKWVLK